MVQNSGDIPPDITGYNDAIAEVYDEVVTPDSWSVNERVVEALGHIGPVRRMLDLGAGTGKSIEAIRQLTIPHHVTAIDTSSGMLAQLHAKHPGVKTVQGLIEAMPIYRQSRFDLITAIGSLEFVPNLAQVLPYYARMLREGGTFVGTYIPREDIDRETFSIPRLNQAFTEYYYDPDAIEGALVSSGLNVETTPPPLAAYTRAEETVSYNIFVARRSER